jgi:hypothetical protein
MQDAEESDRRALEEAALDPGTAISTPPAPGVLLLNC